MFVLANEATAARVCCRASVQTGVRLGADDVAMVMSSCLMVCLHRGCWSAPPEHRLAVCVCVSGCTVHSSCLSSSLQHGGLLDQRRDGLRPRRRPLGSAALLHRRRPDVQVSRITNFDLLQNLKTKQKKNVNVRSTSCVRNLTCAALVG